MRDGWRKVRLSELAEHRPGQYLPKEKYASGGRFTVFGSNSVMGTHSDYLYEGPFVVLARIGSYCGKVAFAREPAWVNNNASALLPVRGAIDASYLYLVLDAMDMSPFRGGSGQPFMQIGSLMAAQVEIPGLDEQRRIVDLVGALDDAIDAAVRFQDRSAQLLAHLVDFELREAGGEPTRLGDVLTVARGGSPRPIDDFYTDDVDGLNWVRIGDVADDGKYIVKTEKRIRREGLNKTRTVEPGDFVLSNSMSFGRPYIMRISGCIHDGWLKLSDFQSSMTEDFLYYMLRSSEMQNRLESLAAGTGVRNLNKEKVAGITVMLPPLIKQHAITSRLDQLGEVQIQADGSVKRMHTLRANLLTALLSGEHEIPESYDALLDDVEVA